MTFFIFCFIFQHFPFLDDFKGGYSFHFGYNQIQKVDSFVTTRKGLEDFVEFLETGKRKLKLQVMLQLFNTVKFVHCIIVF